jgi:murein DD-endopeptidase MepM/ murein hydrolase activator NlpD
MIFPAGCNSFFLNLQKTPAVMESGGCDAAFRISRREIFIRALPKAASRFACRRAPKRGREIHRVFFFAALLFYVNAFAQSPFQFPTANHALYEIDGQLKFFAPTAPDKPWTSGSFGCVRDDRQRMHEGLDIRHLQTDKRGEPADPVMATADGTVVYFSDRPALSN